MALTQQQNDTIASLNAAINTALNDANAANAALTVAKNIALACQAKRDAARWPETKDHACNQITAYNAAWDAASATANNKAAVLAAKRKELDDYLASVNASNMLGAGALASDPSFNLQTQQIQANANVQAIQSANAAAIARAKADAAAMLDKAKAEAAAKQKLIITIAVGGFVFLVLVIAGVMIFKKVRSVINKPSEAATS